MPYSAGGTSPNEIYDILLACEQLLLFFRVLLKFQRQRLAWLSRQPQSLRDVLLRTLGPDSIICQIVTESGNPQNRKRGVSGITWYQRYLRVASLLTLNFILWNHRNNPQRMETVFLELEEKIREVQLNKYRSVEILMWIFWKDGRREGAASNAESKSDNNDARTPTLHSETTMIEDEGERDWLVPRIIRTAKRMGDESWDKMQEVLFNFASTWDHDVKDLPWADDDLRREILGELYIGLPKAKT